MWYFRSHFNVTVTSTTIAILSRIKSCMSFFTRESRMLRASLQSSGRLFVCLPSAVCLSVTLVDCIKTVQARITKYSIGLPQVSSLSWQNFSCHWVQGFPSNEGVKEGYPLKRRHFAVIDSNNVKTVADRYIHAAYHNKHWWQAFWID